ncbi:MAG: hypothetical protein NVS3B21_34000 [Acidimicrobiales bacterium]
MLLLPPAKTTARIRLAHAFAPLIAIGVVGLAGCGGGGGAKLSPTPPSPATTVAPGPQGTTGGQNRIALQAFRACMTTNGSPLPTFAPRPSGTDAPGGGSAGGAPPADATRVPGGRGFGGGGGIGNVATSTDPTVQNAFAACKDKLPPGFLEQQQQAQQHRAAFNSCMKDHGVTLPNGPPAVGATPTTMDRTAPAYKDALAVCGQLLPQRPTGTTPTTATS